MHEFLEYRKAYKRVPYEEELVKISENEELLKKSGVIQALEDRKSLNPSLKLKFAAVTDFFDGIGPVYALEGPALRKPSTRPDIIDHKDKSGRVITKIVKVEGTVKERISAIVMMEGVALKFGTSTYLADWAADGYTTERGYSVIYKEHENSPLLDPSNPAELLKFVEFLNELSFE